MTIREARHILSCEGGELTVRELVIEIAWSIGLSASLAWAIAVGQATAWHMLVPMLAEFIAYLLALPILQLIFPHPALLKESRKSLRMIAILVVVIVAIPWFQARSLGGTFSMQWNAESELVWNWIVGTHMQWPMLIAAIHSVRNVTRTVRHLVQHGPPFLGPGMGCGMRIAIFFLASVLVPSVGALILSLLKDFGVRWAPPLNLVTLAWVLWGCLLLAELCTLWFRWDVQHRLEKKGYTVPAE